MLVKDGIKMIDKEFQYEFLKSLENEGRTLKQYIQTLVAEKKLFEKVIYDFVKRTSILWGNHANILDNQIPEEYKITEEEKEAVNKLILSIENEIKKESTRYEDLYYNLSGSSAITVKDTSAYSSSTFQLTAVNRDKDGLIICPNCGKSHYEIGPTYTTLVYCPTIIKDGKTISEDLNRSTTELICRECGHRFTTNGSGLAFEANNGPIPC